MLNALLQSFRVSESAQLEEANATEDPERLSPEVSARSEAVGKQSAQFNVTSTDKPANG